MDTQNAQITDQLDARLLLSSLTALKKGDFSVRLPLEWSGVGGKIADAFNDVVEINHRIADEVQHLSQTVGQEGKISERIPLIDVRGSWKSEISAINGLADSLVRPGVEMVRVITAVANGNLSQTMELSVAGKPLQGEFLRTANIVNTMVERLRGFTAEVTRVAREVGTEGKLGGQAEVKGVAGTWRDLTDNVNSMANNLTGQVRNIADVTKAVAAGDLSKKITVDANGEILELKDTINTMVDQLSSFASEVTRVAREVGSEGKLGGQAEVSGVSGVWQDLTNNVNFMAGNLTGQVRNIAHVTKAVAAGDLSKKITVDVKGEILELKETVNTMVDQLNSFASEVTRVAREVGTEGKLGGQAEVGGAAGTWRDLTDNVNAMANNLTVQVRNIADVTKAVATGDLSKKITVDAKGEILELKETVNTMVDQLNSFASEVTRVAREVGTEGKLGGQAVVKGVAGTWKDLTDNVNAMANNLTVQVRNIAEVSTAIADGDLSKKITVDVRGEILQLKDTINTMVDQLRGFSSEVNRVAREVGSDGRLGGQAFVPGVAGVWKDLTENVNFMAANLTSQVRNIAEVATAIANGDLSKKITVEVKGEILQLKTTMNTMVDQLNAFASEVTRVAGEVGTEGNLGGQAVVQGVSGTWKDLTNNVNLMASNLTSQVRGIAKVVTAVAKGDLKRKLVVQAKGEIAALADTINGMIDTLATFADQVTGVAREVGVEGKLGGQASVPGAAGTWRNLTDNVNQLAANLTTQVRAIAEVASAVSQGDLTRAIGVQASGEVALLKDNINEMIRTLKYTTQKNAEQDWLKTNLAEFTRMLQGQRDLPTVSRMLLSKLAPVVDAQHGVFYLLTGEQEELYLDLFASYALNEHATFFRRFRLGEGLVGQCALANRRILLSDVPDDYIRVSSGLGAAKPVHVMILPVAFEGRVKAVMELASFHHFSPTHIAFLEQLSESVGIVLHTIEANTRTEALLLQSQSMTGELQGQQEELRRTNDQLAEKARQLAQQNAEVEQKGREIEQARVALEEKAEQLALASKYKSEFLASMSHELRTPLNSLLLLSQELANNHEHNLTARQVEYASTINNAGNDLLGLINDILDLSKIESGTVTLDVTEEPFEHLRQEVVRMFRHIAESRQLAFSVDLAPDLPSAINIDAKRLMQVLNNLLSNAFKFTERGGVRLRIGRASSGWSEEYTTLNNADYVAEFTVIDTGVGIPAEKQKIIFEAFQQADAGTARKYGGTGLGLSISREIAQLFKGELRLVRSVPGEGSVFTLYVPQSSAMPWSGLARGAKPGTRERRTITRPKTFLESEDFADDRSAIVASDHTILIVEDDVRFAGLLLEMAHAHGFKGLITARGDEAFALSHRFQPSAIMLDIELPGTIDGWQLLTLAKGDLTTRHIPIHILSVQEDRGRGFKCGAVQFLTKPVSKEALDRTFDQIKQFLERPVKSLLIVEDDAMQRAAMVESLAGDDLQISAVASAEEALKLFESKFFDCLVVDLRLTGMSGFELEGRMRKIPSLKDLPVVVYSGKPLSESEAEWLDQRSQTVIMKIADSVPRLLDETSLFLHRSAANLPEAKRKILEQLHPGSELTGRKVLIVDDDIRNLYALTGLLERHGMEVATAETGKDAIAMLQAAPVDAVLMDVMMPAMDGYETTRRIRSLEQHRNLPILALTAKAMKGDREKCIAAGASDYLPKPVDAEQLVSLLRAWLRR